MVFPKTASGRFLACAIFVSGGALASNTQPVPPSVLIQRQPGVLGGSWEDPATWVQGVVPDDFVLGAYVTAQLQPGIIEFAAPFVAVDRFHTVTRLIADEPIEGVLRKPRIRVRDDLRVMEELAFIDVYLEDGKDLILGGVGLAGQQPDITRVEGMYLLNQAATQFPERTPRITLNNPTRFIGVELNGGDGDSEVPNLVMDGAPLIVSGQPQGGEGSPGSPLSSSSLFRGAMEIRPEQIDVYGSLTFAEPNGFGRVGGTLDAPLTIRIAPDLDHSRVIWSDAWTLGPNGSIDVGNNHLFLDSRLLNSQVRNGDGGGFTSSPALEIDLNRITFAPGGGGNSIVTVRDSLTIEQFRDLRARSGSIQVGQSASGFYDYNSPDGPKSGTDLLGQTVRPSEFRMAFDSSPNLPDILSSSFVLANGTLASDTPGGIVDELDQIDFLWNMTVEGGLDVSDWIAPQHVSRIDRRFANITIRNGPLQASRFSPTSEHTLLDIRVGEFSDIVATPQDKPSGGVTFVNSGLASNIELDVYGYQSVWVEGPFRLGGRLILAESTDNYGMITFRNGVELTGNGTIFGPTDYRPGGEFSEHAIRVEGGNLTIGAGVTIDSNGGFSNGYVFDANDNDVIIDGELSMYGGEYSPSILRAGELWIRDGSFGASAFEVETLRMGRDGSLGVTVQSYALAPVRSTAQNAVLDGELLWSFGYPRPESTDVVTLFESDNITGRFARVVFPSYQDPASSDYRYAVIYESTAVKAQLALFGDANLNGAIEQGDLDAVLNHWGSNNASIADASAYVSWVTGDFTGDGVVDQGDLDAVLNGWGSSAVPDFRGVVVPEPGLALVGLLGTLGVVVRRRRG